ncbi:hypothetical protein ACHAPT_012611 [Fusarium lateritium]
MDIPILDVCYTCGKPEPEVKLKLCLRCCLAQYCGQECQRIDWSSHKEPCRRKNPIYKAGVRPTPCWIDGLRSGDETIIGSQSPPKGLDQPILWPFTRLKNGTFLHDRPEKDVFRILIESYRFRMEEHHFCKGELIQDSLYSGLDDARLGFRRYVQTANTRNGLLPPWWTPKKLEECEEFGMCGRNRQDLHLALEQFAITCDYMDWRYPWELRILAEDVFGEGVVGRSSYPTRDTLAGVEARARERG